MDLRPATDAYLTGVEKFAGKTFLHRKEIGLLIDLAGERSRQTQFDELVFLAKFSSHSFAILKRTGLQSEDTAKLSAEFSESLRRIASLLELLTADAPAEISRIFQTSFLVPSPENMSRLIAFLHELSWLKNYALDTHHLPFSSPPAL